MSIHDDALVRELRLAGAAQTRSAYAVPSWIVTSRGGAFEDLMQGAEWYWGAWERNGDDVLPIATTGWDNRPRLRRCGITAHRPDR